MPKKTTYMKNSVWMSPLIRFTQRIRITGQENIPKEGGYILASNHLAAKDVFLLGGSCPRQLYFIAKKELFSIPLVRGFIKAFGAIKIDRGGNDVGAIRAAVNKVKEGNIVAIFPQGHRYPGVDPEKTEVKNGLGLIAHKAGCPVIPAFIKVKNHRYRPFRRIDIYFGKPIEQNELFTGSPSSAEYERATKLVFSKILSLGKDENIIN